MLDDRHRSGKNAAGGKHFSRCPGRGGLKAAPPAPPRKRRAAPTVMLALPHFFKRQEKVAPLRLYCTDYCYYCTKVRRVVDKLGLEVQLIDTLRDSAARRSLVERRGRPTVPVLGIVTDEGEELLAESEEIIRFLTEYAEATKARRSEPPPRQY